MPETLPPPPPEELLRPVAHLRLKAAVLLRAHAGADRRLGAVPAAMRGAFEPTQRLVLIADDSEGVSVGMDMTFSAFP